MNLKGIDHDGCMVGILCIIDIVLLLQFIYGKITSISTKKTSDAYYVDEISLESPMREDRMDCLHMYV